MDNRLSGVRPDVLDGHLPRPALYFVLEWGFSFNFEHPAFVRVEAFHFAPDHTLRTPVFLGAKPHPDVDFRPVPSHEVALIEDPGGKLICCADNTRTEDRWQARLRSGVHVVGRAEGAVGAKTATQLIEAALIALVRRCAVADA
jgi:hypothetical protein